MTDCFSLASSCSTNYYYVYIATFCISTLMVAMAIVGIFYIIKKWIGPMNIKTKYRKFMDHDEDDDDNDDGIKYKSSGNRDDGDDDDFSDEDRTNPLAKMNDKQIEDLNPQHTQQIDDDENIVQIQSEEFDDDEQS